MRRFSRKSIAASAALMTLALSATGCGSGAPRADAPGTTVRIAALPVVDDVPLYLAKKMGWFKAAGLDVRIVPMEQSTQAIPGLLHGSIQVVDGNYTNFLEAAAQHVVDVRVIADGYRAGKDCTVAVALPDGKVQKPADLEGKTVAFSLLHSVTTLTFDATMKSENLDPAKVKHVQIPFPEMAAALQRHRVDAAVMVEPFITDAARQLGTRTIMDTTYGGAADKWPMSGYLATTAWVHRYPRQAQRLRAVIHHANLYASGHRAEVQRILPTYTQMDKQTATLITLGVWPSTLSPEHVQRVADLMSSNHLLPEGYDVKPLLDITPAGTSPRPR